MRFLVVSLFLIAQSIFLNACYSPFARNEHVGSSKDDTVNAEITGGVHAWPLVERMESKDYKRTDFLWPFFKYENSPDKVKVRVFPLLWISNTKWNDWLVVFPFFARHDRMTLTSGEDTPHLMRRDYCLFPPISHYKYQQEEDLRVFPFFVKSKDQYGQEFGVWPLFGSKTSNGETERYFLWPFGRYKVVRSSWATTDNSVRSQDIRRNVSFPWPLFNMEHNVTRSNVWNDDDREVSSFPLFRYRHHNREMLITPRAEVSDDYSREDSFYFFDFDYRDDEPQFSVLWRLAYREIEPEKRRTVFFPFYYHESNRKGDSSTGMLLDLVNRTKKDGKVTWRYLWFF